MMEAEKRRKELLQGLHCVQLCMPDIHCVPRGKVVFGEFKDDLSNVRFDFYRGMPLLGPKCETPLSVPQLTAAAESHELRPCIETLTPWPWVSSEGRSVGNVLCDMYLPDGSADRNCPRQQLKTQLDALWQNHGLVVKTGFEYEFFAYKDKTLEPMGLEIPQSFDLRVCAQYQPVLNELWETLESMGVKVSAMHGEHAPGQWEITTVPNEGVTAADVAFYVKNAVKGFLGKHGYSATFMTHPKLKGNASGLHLNHSLWRPASLADGEKERNVFLSNRTGCLSPTARHWLAGLLTHGKALSALLCPSINCYRRLFKRASPSLCVWGMNNRHALIRARVDEDNAYLENRLVSGAASPYLALAATLAAGMDGLQRRLECPKAMDLSEAEQLPKTLEMALTCLEEDRELVDLLGEDFVNCYVNSKQEVEIAPFKRANLKTEEEKLAYEKDLYFKLY